MKKAIFISILIVSFLYSCDNSSDSDLIDTKPLIYKFVPDSGYSNSQISIYGKNFIESSGVRVFFDSTEAIVKRISYDSILAVVPEIPIGDYSITLLVGEDKITTQSTFKVLGIRNLIDYSTLRNYKYVIKNLHVLYHKYEYRSSYPPGKGSSIDTVYEIANYQNSFSSYNNLFFTEMGDFYFRLSYYPYYYRYCDLYYWVDQKKMIFSKLDFHFEMYKDGSNPHGGVYWIVGYHLVLENVPFSVIGDSALQVSLTGNDINKYAKTIRFPESGDNGNPTRSESYDRDIYKILDQDTNARLTFILHR